MRATGIYAVPQKRENTITTGTYQTTHLTTVTRGKPGPKPAAPQPEPKPKAAATELSSPRPRKSSLVIVSEVHDGYVLVEGLMLETTAKAIAGAFRHTE